MLSSYLEHRKGFQMPPPSLPITHKMQVARPLASSLITSSSTSTPPCFYIPITLTFTSSKHILSSSFHFISLISQLNTPTPFFSIKLISTRKYLICLCLFSICFTQTSSRRTEILSLRIVSSTESKITLHWEFSYLRLFVYMFCWNTSSSLLG